MHALPATFPGKLISLRYADAEGQEYEVGMVRDLSDWPGPSRQLLEQALSRRYFIRVITAIEAIKLKYGLLTLRVHTDCGPTQFMMRNSQSHAQDFGARGKLLTDVDDHRYLLPDPEDLPSRQRHLFQRYIYW